MPQWRKLHGKVVENLDVNDMLDDFTRILWILLPTQLCCEGRGQDNPAWVQAKVFPLRVDVTLDMIEDKSIDIAIRVWVKTVFIKGKHTPPPPELCELIQRQAAKMIKPSALGLVVEDTPFDFNEWFNE